MTRIGLIGTGVMGTGMVKNLLAADFPVTVYNRTKAHSKKARDLGADWAADPLALLQKSDVVISIVGFPQDVEQVYFGDHGLIANAQPGQVLIDMTTSKPSLARQITQAAAKRHIQALDAPVSGGDIGADKGTLTIMVGGDQATYQQLQPVFAAIGQEINYFGPAGQGQETKMANQIMIAGTMTGLCEMLVYARKMNLDLKTVLKTVGGGSAANWSLTNYGPRILQGDYTPGFFAKHFLKDLRIALDEAKASHLELPATRQAAALYETLVDDKGLGNEGTQALVKLWWPES